MWSDATGLFGGGSRWLLDMNSNQLLDATAFAVESHASLLPLSDSQELQSRSNVNFHGQARASKQRRRGLGLFKETLLLLRQTKAVTSPRTPNSYAVVVACAST